MWICARTHPKKEKLVVDQLRHRAGMKVVAPRFRSVRKTRSGKKPVTQYLFPCYIFVECFDPDDCQLVRYTTGVTRLVERGAGPIEVPDTVIRDLCAAYPDDAIYEADDPALQPGSRIEIVAGSLKTIKATVLAYLSVKDRLKILIEFLGRDTEIEIPANQAIAISGGDDDDD